MQYGKVAIEVQKINANAFSVATKNTTNNGTAWTETVTITIRKGNNNNNSHDSYYRGQHCLYINSEQVEMPTPKYTIIMTKFSETIVGAAYFLTNQKSRQKKIKAATI